MGTRSHIGMMFEDGSISSVYCNFDSDKNGQILKDNYNDPKKIIELLSYGDMSQLKETIEECIFYARDRDEDLSDTEMRTFICEADFLDTCREDYTYLFKDGSWYNRQWNKPLRKINEKQTND